LPAGRRRGWDSTLIEGAKKEKRLVHWTTMTLSQSKQVVDAFKRNILQVFPIKGHGQIIRRQAEKDKLLTTRDKEQIP
jgi:hypothetical protein